MYLIYIEKHWILSVNVEFSLEKLLLMTYTSADRQHKVRWMKWWNASPHTQKARKFLATIVTKNKLAVFLSKVLWWVGVSILCI